MPIAPDVWEYQDVTAGKLWSSRTAADGAIEQGFGGAPFYSLADVDALDAGATVQAIALNVGTYNPGWTALADGVQFNDHVFDFEPKVALDAGKDDCKDGGWQELTDTAGVAFVNQGDCVSYFASDGKSRGPKRCARRTLTACGAPANGRGTTAFRVDRRHPVCSPRSNHQATAPLIGR